MRWAFSGLVLAACAHAGARPAPDLQALRLHLAGRWDDAIGLLLERRAAAQARGDRASEAHLLAQLSEVERDRALARGGDAVDALAHAVKARAIAESIGDRAALAAALDAAAMVLYWRRLLAARGDWDPIAQRFAAALELRQALADRAGIAESYFHVGLVAQMRGRPAEAGRWYERSLAHARAIGDALGISYALRHQADLAQEAGDRAQALAYHRESLRLREQVGFTAGIAYALIAIAPLDPPRAREHLERALALAAPIGHLMVQASAELELARLDARAGARTRAADRLARALRAAQATHDVATEIDVRLERARLLAAGAECARARLEIAAARAVGAGTEAAGAIEKAASGLAGCD